MTEEGNRDRAATEAFVETIMNHQDWLVRGAVGGGGRDWPSV